MKKNPGAVALGKLRAAKGPSMEETGSKGGLARAKNLTKQQKSAIAKKAAAARWGTGKARGWYVLGWRRRLMKMITVKIELPDALRTCTGG
jgi:hypothetical protein